MDTFMKGHTLRVHNSIQLLAVGKESYISKVNSQNLDWGWIIFN